MELCIREIAIVKASTMKGTDYYTQEEIAEACNILKGMSLSSLYSTGTSWILQGY